ncbi:hypothetical protein K505DRAFT_258992 [Melanomma pulvis-pyrius CBS 109.77]|uniref:Uncharacterized protein n=1 Tax=Melanomma pulvis-pyrius CBS 109.77 TaxID=1314802 RepID=A0A6A6WRX8_9PLEO|nr:hypothetical protein K505DRAFT_258992 [Melanomma pulvis-pyrius CBS 109.77]
MRILTPSPKTAQQLEDEEWNHCGRSSSLAIERGCVMEPFFYGWMPPRCVFPELSEQYPVFSNRKWYKHENKTVELSEDDLWKGKHKFIYTEKYHGEHCLFQWRKLQYGMQNRKDYLDNKTISGHHANHCADQISIACEAPGDVSKVELGFYRCRKTVW